jgi:Fur family peroxide stress response transcriptional regulator
MERIIAKYKSKGLRLTPQRIAILRFLEGNTSHPTAEDIYREIKRDYPTISFATVYNTLQALKENGDILEITIDPARRHYDPDTSPHHHIICLDCNEIRDVFVDYSEVLKLPAQILGEFKTVGNHVDFYGLCKKCLKKQALAGRTTLNRSRERR